MKNKRKFSKQIIIGIVIIGFIFFHFYVPRFITEIKNPIVNLIKPNKYKEKTILEKQHLFFNSFDDTKLSYFFLYSSIGNTKGTIILLHGIRSSKEHFITLSNKLSRLGYNVVALDLRAHGKSEGVHCTFGVKEKKDVSALITMLLMQGKINKNIGIWGQSLGGAIGLQAMAFDSRIKFGIIESTFSNFRTVTHDYFNFHLGFNIRPFTNYLIDRSGKIANFNPEDAKPIKYCEKITQPILLVHGNKDQRISIDYARRNLEKISSKHKELIEIKNATHLNVWEIGGNNYFQKVKTFLNKTSVK